MPSATGRRQPPLVAADAVVAVLAATRAAGEAAAIELVYGAIHRGGPTNDLLAVKYLEALARIGDGRATKIFLPLDGSGMTGALAGLAELFRETHAERVASDGPGELPTR